MWQVYLQMFKVVANTEREELRMWVTFLHSCQQWLLTHFLMIFQVSVKGRLTYSFLRESCCSSWTHNPAQTLAAQPAVTHPPYSLSSFSSTWTHISDLLGRVRGGVCVWWGRQAKVKISLGSSNDFKGQIRGEGREQVGRRLPLTQTPHFPV